jgi:antitoxin (DNA-binding transcriptional repressor) of toxin-antitoxin stability system
MFKMFTKTVDIEKTQSNLKELLSQVVDGQEIVIMEGDKPIARISPITQRVPGLHPGAIWTSEDFDEPLPEDFWAGKA